MKKTLIGIWAAAFASSATLVAAQPTDRGPWFYQIEGAVLYQPDVDMDDDGSFSLNRWTARLGVIRMIDAETSIGISVGAGVSNYEFDEATLAGEQPWDRIEDYRLSVPIRFGFGETGKAIIVPTVRYYGETGSNWEDGTTYGLIAGVSWQITPTLRLGPGFGAFSTIDDGTNAFPIIVIDWSITEKLELTTGQGLGATQGPGLTLNYQANDDWKFGLVGRFDKLEYRLNDDGPVPGGVGQDRSVPVLATVAYEPNPALSVAAFAGMKFDGRLSLKDNNGDLVDRRDYKNTPVFGGSIRLRF